MNNLQFTIYNRIGITLFIVFCLLSISASIASAQSVDILFQGEGYVSPFYQGRALWGKQSRVTLLAVPQGLGNPAALDYLWSKNGTVLGNISGVGKNSLSFSDPLFSKPVVIKVEIVRGDEELLAEKSVTLLPVSPLLAIYEDNPLYGFMLHREIGAGYAMEEAEVTFAAFPLFSARPRTASGLSYLWRSNNGEAEERNSITYRSPEGGSGTASVSLRFSDPSLVLPATGRSFLIQFSQ